MTVEWDIDKTIADVEAAASSAVVDGAEAIKGNAIKKILTGAKTGRIYRRRGVLHQASAPGEPPANDTGRLVQSGRTEFDKEDIAADVVFGTKYAAALEFGRLDGTIAARPYARPALKEESEKFLEGVEAKIIEVL